MLVVVSSFEQRRIRKEVFFLSNIVIIDVRSVVAIGLVDTVRKSKVVEVENPKSADVTTSAYSSRVAHRRTVDIVEHVAFFFKQRFGIDSKVLEDRESNQYFLGGEIGIGDEKSEIYQCKWSDGQFEEDTRWSSCAGE